MEHRCRNLVLDAGPLLSLSPLRGLAETYYTVPQVLEELKDRRAREHFERLGLNAGVKIEIKEPDAAALSHGTLATLLMPDETLISSQ
jgi:RNA-binding protein NOB1